MTQDWADKLVEGQESGVDPVDGQIASIQVLVCKSDASSELLKEVDLVCQLILLGEAEDFRPVVLSD